MAIDPTIIAARSANVNLNQEHVPPPRVVFVATGTYDTPTVDYSTSPAAIATRPQNVKGLAVAVADDTNNTARLGILVPVATSGGTGGAVEGLAFRDCKPSSSAIDPRTGRLYDPLAEFYNPLAT